MTERDWSLDTIGRRLSGEGLSEQEKVLAADDKVRVDWILSQFHGRETVLDIGASDGAISRLLYSEHGARLLLVEKHPAHQGALVNLAHVSSGWYAPDDAMNVLQRWPLNAKVDTALLCEVCEHMHGDRADVLFHIVRSVARRVIVTVPNSNAQSYEANGRARFDFPDHKSFYDQTQFRDTFHCTPVPIVGTLNDSIWLGGIWRE